MSLIQIGKGHVYHSRKEGADNSFRYPTFFVFFNCDHEVELKELLKSQFQNSISFSAQEYLKGDETSLTLRIRNFLKTNCNFEAEEVWLHTMPKMLGYAFNPVSFWFCKRDGKVEAVLVEVNNTFGERHFYWIHPSTAIQSEQWLRAEKVFHVSPFMPVEGFYNFRFDLTDESVRVDINYHNPEGPLRLATWVTGALSELSKESAWSVFKRYGWITPMVVVRIHYQALKLFYKKSKFYRKPALPSQEVSS